MNNPHRPLPINRKEGRKHLHYIQREQVENKYKEVDINHKEDKSKDHTSHVPFVETSFFIRAVHALRKEDRHTQLFFSFLISGVITFAIMLLLLHYRYGFFNNDEIVYEEKILVAGEKEKNTEVNNHFNNTPFFYFVEEVQKRFSQMTIPTSFSKIPRELFDNTFDNTKVYESK